MLPAGAGDAPAAVERGLGAAAGDRTFQWLVTLRDMVREIREPDPLPSFQPVNVWVGTWNMGNAAPDADQLRHWLNLDHKVHELYAVGLQESAFKIKKAEGYGGGGGAVTRYLVDAFLGALGAEYKLVESRQCGRSGCCCSPHEELPPHVECWTPPPRRAASAASAATRAAWRWRRRCTARRSAS